MLAARRSGNGSVAKLLKVAPEALRTAYVPNVPTFEQVHEERGPDEMCSKQDLIERLQEEHRKPDAGQERRTRRNAGSRARQIVVLNRFESLVNANPDLNDGVDQRLECALRQRRKGRPEKEVAK